MAFESFLLLFFSSFSFSFFIHPFDLQSVFEISMSESPQSPLDHQEGEEDKDKEEEEEAEDESSSLPVKSPLPSSSSAAAAPSLPPGWSAHWDATSSKYYFWNQTTGIVTWSPPTDEHQTMTNHTTSSPNTSAAASASTSSSAASTASFSSSFSSSSSTPYASQSHPHYSQQASYQPPSWAIPAYSATGEGEGDSEDDPLAKLDKLLDKIDTAKPVGAKRKAAEIEEAAPMLNYEQLYGKEEHLNHHPDAPLEPQQAQPHWWDHDPRYAAQAAFNKKSGRMQAPGFDETHYNVVSKAYRQMSFYFDVESWEKQRQEQGKKGAPKLSKKELEKRIKEQKEKKDRDKKQWLLED